MVFVLFLIIEFQIMIVWTGTLVFFTVCDSVKFSNISYGVDLCDKPLTTDLCAPGGKWDPLLERFVHTSTIKVPQAYNYST